MYFLDVLLTKRAEETKEDRKKTVITIPPVVLIILLILGRNIFVLSLNDCEKYVNDR
jgi:hypothetical protein